MPAINADSLNNPGVNFENQSSDPAAPGSGRALIYVKNGGAWILLDTGDPTLLGGAPALEYQLLGVGDGGGLLSGLAAGSEGAVPTRQSDGTIAEVVPTGGGGGGGRTLIDSHTVPSGGEAAYSFTGVPGTYGYLELEVYGRAAGAGGYAKLIAVQFNGDTGANYSHATAGINGFQVNWTADYVATFGTFAALPGPQATAANVGWARLTIPHYAETVWRKVSLSHFVLFEDDQVGEEGGGQGLVNWRSTAAITRVDVLAPSGFTLVQGTVLSLYGRD